MCSNNISAEQGAPGAPGETGATGPDVSASVFYIHAGVYTMGIEHSSQYL